MYDINEKSTRELWFTYFTRVIYDKGLITADRKLELEKRIALLNTEKEEEVA